MRRALAAVLSATGLRAFVERVRPWSGVVILNYHRVGDGKDSLFDRGLWSADTESFADQIRFAHRHLEIITPADLADVRTTGRGRYGMVTFDDGYRDNHDIAFPILRAEAVPATFFVATGFIDHPTLPWWDEIAWLVRTSTRRGVDLHGWLPALTFDEPDREQCVRALLRAYKALPADAGTEFLAALRDASGVARPGPDASRELWMDWDMLRAMRDAGMTIGGHTVSHPVLARATPEQQRAEIAGCGRRLQEELGESMRCFAYPVGQPDSFDATTRACLRECGVQYAFSFYGGRCRFNDWDALDLHRVPVETDLTRAQFRGNVTLPWLFP